MTNIQDRHFKSVWKKTFASVANAYRLSLNDDEFTMPPEAIDKSFTAETYYRVFSNLKTLNFCVSNVNFKGNCSIGNLPYINYKSSLNGNVMCTSLNGDKVKGACAYNSQGGHAVMLDGVYLFAHFPIWSHPDIMVDVNGPSGPNVVGRDIFIILIRNDKVIAGGAPGYVLKGCTKKANSNNGHVHAEDYAGSGCGYKYLMEK